MSTNQMVIIISEIISELPMCECVTTFIILKADSDIEALVQATKGLWRCEQLHVTDCTIGEQGFQALVLLFPGKLQGGVSVEVFLPLSLVSPLSPNTTAIPPTIPLDTESMALPSLCSEDNYTGLKELVLDGTKTLGNAATMSVLTHSLRTVKAISALNHLSLSGCGIDLSTLDSVVDAVLNMPSLAEGTLDLSHNGLPRQAGILLGKLIR